MVIYLAADHRGFALKEHLKGFLKAKGYEVDDVGDAVLDEADDYPVFAAAAAGKISVGSEDDRAVICCGSGAGVAVVANKFRRVRAALAISSDQIFDAREDDDVNILALAADFTSKEDAEKIVGVFLSTPFRKAERDVRRLAEIARIEDERQAG